MRFLLAAVLVLALALAGCGSDDGADDAGSTGPVTVTVTETETVTQEPEVSCSTAGLRLTLPEQELPAEVAEVRQRVFEAAVACDYDTLEEVALEKGAGFTFSYGGETDASEHWQRLEEEGTEEPMRALATILTLPNTRNEAGSYAWPSTYNESPTDADWQAVVDAGLYTQEQIDLMKTQGTGYLGWRTAITPDGDWQFFVAGD
jgi:hypothetical protein